MDLEFAIYATEIREGGGAHGPAEADRKSIAEMLADADIAICEYEYLFVGSDDHVLSGIGSNLLFGGAGGALDVRIGRPRSERHRQS